MEKKELVQYLKTIYIKLTSDEDKEALNEAIEIINKSKNWEDRLRVVDILLKILGIGSKFFDK